MNPHLTCITCKFYTPAENVIGFATCKEPKSAYPDHVNGGISWTFCHNMRNDFGECKPAAELWEPNAETAAVIEKDKVEIRAHLKRAAEDGDPYETDQPSIDELRARHSPTLLADDELHDLICDFVPYEQEYTGEENL